jgi:hypothetical protein
MNLCEQLLIQTAQRLERFDAPLLLKLTSRPRSVKNLKNEFLNLLNLFSKSLSAQYLLQINGSAILRLTYPRPGETIISGQFRATRPLYITSN